MFPIREFEKRFREILASFDEFVNDDEEIEELNAQFEDALFVIECIDPDEEDWEEEFIDALEEFKDLLEEYRSLENDLSGLADATDRLDMAIRMAQTNLKV